MSVLEMIGECKLHNYSEGCKFPFGNVWLYIKKRKVAFNKQPSGCFKYFK